MSERAETARLKSVESLSGSEECANQSEIAANQGSPRLCYATLEHAASSIGRLDAIWPRSHSQFGSTLVRPKLVEMPAASARSEIATSSKQKYPAVC